MARKRMVDPEFWSDEKVANLSLRARLLFIGIWNYADDEGIIKARPEFLKSSVFPYDAVSTEDIGECIEEVNKQNLIFKYEIQGQSYCIVLNFLKHQVINKPLVSKLPKPSIQNPKYKDAIFKRDNWICHLCGDDLSNYPSKVIDQGDGKLPSVDHIIPQSKGGNDLPSNLKTACLSCNKKRGNKDLPDDYGSTTELLHSQMKGSEIEMKSNEVKKIYGEFKKVRLTSQEYEKLIKSLGEKNTLLLIGELDNYIASKGKRYASHYATLLNWARRKITEHQDKNKPKRTLV